MASAVNVALMAIARPSCGIKFHYVAARAQDTISVMSRAILPFAILMLAGQLRAQTYDLVVAGGRVLDPASNLDAVRHIGIRAGKIAAISATPPQGRETLDAAGLTVAPGFIDLHSHGQTPENYRFKARDGVTTALEMEIGVNPVAAW